MNGPPVWRPGSGGELSAEVRLIESSGGVFEVMADGVPVYSKKRTGAFPDEALLVARLRGG